MRHMYQVGIYGSEDRIGTVHLTVFADTPAEAYEEACDGIDRDGNNNFCLQRILERDDFLHASNIMVDAETGEVIDVLGESGIDAYDFIPGKPCTALTTWQVKFVQDFDSKEISCRMQAEIYVQASCATCARERALREFRTKSICAHPEDAHIVYLGVCLDVDCDVDR